MTDADSFYDKLLASIGLPSDEPHTSLPQDCGRKSQQREQKTTSETQQHHQPEPHQKPEIKKHEPVPKQQLEPRRNTSSSSSSSGGSTATLSPKLKPPPKPSTSAAELREKLSRQIERPPPPPPPRLPRISHPQSPAPVPVQSPIGGEALPVSPAPISPQIKEDEVKSSKTPAALEAELRRKLLESGVRKRKSSPLVEGQTAIVDGKGKRQRVTPPPTVGPIANPQPPAQIELPPPPPPHTIAASTAAKNGDVAPEPLSGTEFIKSRQAELRRKLLERSNNLKQNSSAVNIHKNPPTQDPGPTRVINRSYSPIEISSDEDGGGTQPHPPLSVNSKSNALPPFLPKRPPPREGFKLRITVPLPTNPSESIVLRTEKLPLSTPISTILGLFGAARDGDHLYFPGTNPKPTAEKENDEKMLGEDGQRFYRDGDETGRAGIIKEAIVKKEDGWDTRSAGSSLKGAASSLRGDAIDYMPGGSYKAAIVAEPQWTGISATLEDVWTRGRKAVECTLVRANNPVDADDHGLSQLRLEDRGNVWNSRHQHRNSRSDFSTGMEQPWDEQNGEEGEVEGEEEGEGEGEGWGYGNEGYPESSEGGPNMSWGPGYPMAPGHPQTPWAEQFPMIPNTNIRDPNAQPWYPGQAQYQHSAQPSPVFSQHDEGQGPAFMGGGLPVPQAMHWVPGHMDYANAGWMYGFGPNDSQQNVGMSSGVEPVEATPNATSEVNKVVADGKPPGPVQNQQPQQPRVQVGPTKPKRPRGGRIVKKKERRKGAGGGRGGGGVSGVN